MSALGRSNSGLFELLVGFPNHPNGIFVCDDDSSNDDGFILRRSVDVLSSGEGVTYNAPQDLDLSEFGNEYVLNWRRLYYRPRHGARHLHTQPPVNTEVHKYFINVLSTSNGTYLGASRSRDGALRYPQRGTA